MSFFSRAREILGHTDSQSLYMPYFQQVFQAICWPRTHCTFCSTFFRTRKILVRTDSQILYLFFDPRSQVQAICWPGTNCNYCHYHIQIQLQIQIQTQVQIQIQILDHKYKQDQTKYKYTDAQAMQAICWPRTHCSDCRLVSNVNLPLCPVPRPFNKDLLQPSTVAFKKSNILLSPFV